MLRNGPTLSASPNFACKLLLDRFYGAGAVTAVDIETRIGKKSYSHPGRQAGRAGKEEHT